MRDSKNKPDCFFMYIIAGMYLGKKTEVKFILLLVPGTPQFNP